MKQLIWALLFIYFLINFMITITWFWYLHKQPYEKGTWGYLNCFCIIPLVGFPLLLLILIFQGVLKAVKDGDEDKSWTKVSETLNKGGRR